MATLPNGPFPSARDGSRGVPQDRLAGGAATFQLIQGMEGVLKSTTAAIQEMRAAAREMAVANDRASRMSTSVGAVSAVGTAEILRILNESMGTQGATSTLAQVSALTASLAAPVSAPGDVVRASASPEGGGPPMTPDRPGGPDPLPDDAPLAPEVKRSNFERLHAARGYNVKQLRNDTSRWLGAKVSGAQIGPNLREAQNRRGWEIFDPASGESMGPASSRQIRNMAIANRIRAVGGTVAEQGLGKGLVNAIPKGVAGPAAVAAGGVMVANQVAQFAEEQREANAQYQRALGGSNVEAFGERGRQALFSLSQRGTMSDRQSAALYEGVTGMGLTGRNRMDALDLATENWRKFGMEINSSIELIRVNARNGIQSLTGIAEALDEVTTSARESGVSAEAARQMYTQAYSAAAPNLMGEGSAAVTAGAMTAAFTDLGPGYQDVDVSQMFSTNTMRMIGARQGMTQGEMLSQTSGLQGGLNYTRMSQAAIIDLANRLLGTRGKEMISEFKRQRGISGTLSSTQADDLAVEMYGANIVQPQAVMSSLQPYGINLSANKALSFLILAIDGGWNPEAQVQNQITNSTSRALSESERSNFKTDDVEGVTSMGEVLSAIGGDPGIDTFTDADSIGPDGNVVKGETRLTMQTSGSFGRQSEDTARGLYATQVQSGKQEFSPIIAGMLKQGDFDQRFKINVGTENAPEWREMNMYDAIKYHSDQLARGDVQITKGTGEGRQLADVLGLAPDESVDIDYSGAGANKGSAVTDGTATSAGVSGSVEIFASPELQRLLRFRSTGGATMVTEPPSSLGSNASLPTGNQDW